MIAWSGKSFAWWQTFFSVVTALLFETEQEFLSLYE
jgi:hypothetical protein